MQILASYIRITIGLAVTFVSLVAIYFASNLQACYSFFGNVVGSYKDFWTSYTFNIISKFRRRS
jgi:hypothetical protein